ncbi:flagellar filament capping protein FliD [Planctomicrobium piriforme]|uniref:Flagellar hook-associated protein 2 n=1 Tax=Planctomicrobium piriforme TaxID=1576369 RepID=A0A1I3HNT3_9PLAN|nr:flagellar filament capping protein FliD [Planctomicrobium piriforme]SFI37237.1 flagellar hook-associated protein 2 [Planctomicrobium piriforme]
MSNINIGGLISGINTDSIIEGMLKIQQNQLDIYNTRKTAAETKKTAYQSMQTQLLSLRTTASTLASATNNPFDSRAVTVSNADALVATAGPKAVAGTYQLTVNTLATAHTVASQDFADPDSAITQGTFSIRVGTQTQADITIDGSNDSLAGLADSINFANIGVNASIVQDGNSSYRLLLTSTKTGASNTINVTNGLADSTPTAFKPTFDFDNPVQAAGDASVTLGGGSGALTVSSATNNVSNLITGVTLNVVAADPSTPLTVTVAPDAAKASKAVNDFVTAYNSFLDFVDSVTTYDADTDTGAILQGDYSAISIRGQLQSAIQSIIPGGSTKSNRLSALGIVTSDTGRLTVNDTQLQSFINGDVNGVTSANLRHLFAIDGQSNNGNVTFLMASAKTKETTSPIQVNVTQAAERATLTAGTALAASTVIDSSNNSLRLNLDGVETTVTLQEGTYTRAELADQVEAVINGNSTFVGRTVSVGVNASNQLAVTSDSYGSSSRVTIYASSAVNGLGFNGGESDVGVNVAGEFIVNGQAETATGNGRNLTGAEGNATTDGLQVRISLTPAQVTSGNEGTLSITRGVTSRMNSIIDQLLDAHSGMLVSLEDQFNRQITSIQDQIDSQQAIFDKQKESLTSQFNAMETALQQLQSTSSLLGSQLSSIKSLSSSS